MVERDKIIGMFIQAWAAFGSNVLQLVSICFN